MLEDNRLIICENCGLPIETVDDYGSELSGSRSNRFCKNCYEKGEFTGMTMTPEQIQELVVKKMSGQSAEYIKQMTEGMNNNETEEEEVK